ncbi:MAG: AbrB/MazE/SpoVT family DNA-binding domain-containing protein [Deltaproteobacteria bacterium]|nr:AbrB/MazE/SpoVT family DNA-binding domain-containing protein [Deltaproteobacteria bacterium]
MATTIQINKRGTLTLPKELRKRLGLERGGVIMAEETNEGIVLKPAVAFPIEMYTDSRMKEFAKEDERLMAHIKKRSTG